MKISKVKPKVKFCLHYDVQFTKVLDSPVICIYALMSQVMMMWTPSRRERKRCTLTV